MRLRNETPQWVLDHRRENVTMQDWMNIIADYYAPDFEQSGTGRPRRLTRSIAMKLFEEFVNSGSMPIALEKVGIHRSTVWRWRQKYLSIYYMDLVVRAFNKHQKEHYSSFWDRRRKQHLRVLQRKRGVFTSLKDYQYGRPTTYDPDKHLEVEDTLEETAEKFGVSKRTVINWMRLHYEFRQRIMLRRIEKRIPGFEREAHKLFQEGESLGIVIDTSYSEASSDEQSS